MPSAIDYLLVNALAWILLVLAVIVVAWFSEPEQ